MQIHKNTHQFDCSHQPNFYTEKKWIKCVFPTSNITRSKFIISRTHISPKFFVLFHGIYSKHFALFQTTNLYFDGDCDDLIRNKRWNWTFSTDENSHEQSINSHFPNFLSQTIEKYEEKNHLHFSWWKERESLKDTKRNRVE